MTKPELPKIFDFEPLRQTWARLADSTGGELISEHYKLDFVMDFAKFPFGDLILEKVGSINEIGRNLPQIFRPRLKLQRKRWMIELSTLGRLKQTEDSFLVVAEATFISNMVFYFRVKSKTAWQPIADSLIDTKFMKDWQNWSNSLVLRMPKSFTLAAEALPGCNLVRSRSIELDDRFKFETNDEELLCKLFSNWRLREHLLSSAKSITSVIFKSGPHVTSNCVFISGSVSAKSIEQSDQFLVFAEDLLEMLFVLDVIADSDAQSHSS